MLLVVPIQSPLNVVYIYIYVDLNLDPYNSSKGRSLFAGDMGQPGYTHSHHWSSGCVLYAFGQGHCRGGGGVELRVWG